MGNSKLKKVKQKTHKATKKRFKKTASGKIMHEVQGAGSGHSRSYMNRRQKKARRGADSLSASKEHKKISNLLND